MPKLFVDHVSQPSRTTMIFCRMNDLGIEECLVNIAKGGTREASFLAMNPLGKVPFLFEKGDGGNDFGLPESSAIMRYLCSTRVNSIPPHWYPYDAKARAKIDAVMAWHGSTLRIGSMIVVWNLAIAKFLKFPTNEKLVEGYGMPTLKAALITLDTVWLKNNSGFVAGNTISIADLLLACEIEQLCLLDAVPEAPSMAVLLAPHPSVAAWLSRVRASCQPHYDSAHSMLRAVRDRLMKARSKI